MEATMEYYLAVPTQGSEVHLTKLDVPHLNLEDAMLVIVSPDRVLVVDVPRTDSGLGVCHNQPREVDLLAQVSRMCDELSYRSVK
jgi:hypothetical protein